MPSRLKKFSQLLIHQKLDAYLVMHAEDIFYLTGFQATGAWLLVTPKRAYYMTDSRYSEEAHLGLGDQAVVWLCRQGLESELVKILRYCGIKRLGFDERYCSVARLKRMKAICAGIAKIVALNGVIEKMRMIKDDIEIAQIRGCVAVNKEAYRYLKRVIRPGIREREILWKLEDFLRRRQVGFAFNPIIASGQNSALPHACLTDRIIKNIDIILIDLGIRINGYNSDLTRIFLSDKIPRSYKDVYEAVAEAQEVAISQIRCGIRAAEVDCAARKSLKKNKLDKFFTHALGHGVGIEIHESPRLSARSAEILQDGMVVTVEPGVYFPGKFGMRIEDMVLVKDKGYEVLSRGAKVEEPFYF